MATNRTGTSAFKKLRSLAVANAIANGQTHCPLCKCRIEWDRARIPTAPEADHIVPASQGGTDVIENIRIICRRCNQRLGGLTGAQQRYGRAPRPPAESKRLETSGIW